MVTLANVLVALVALAQIWCMIVEMFLWRTPVGVGNYNLSQEFADASAKLAANKGIYNGLLATGLIWSLAVEPHSFALQVFCLGCAIVAGVYCAATVSRRIFFVQALPAAVALALVALAH